MKYIIAAGSSHNKGEKYLSDAISIASSRSNISIAGLSKTYRNNSQGTNFNRLFFNCAIAIESNLQPVIFYRELKTIEQTLGRIRSDSMMPRTIDLDVIMSLDCSYRSCNFFLPHREAFNRKFFVVPAIESTKSAGWPTPFLLLKARTKFARQYLCPL